MFEVSDRCDRKWNLHMIWISGMAKIMAGIVRCGGAFSRKQALD